jgi:hypothetical protein
MTEGRSLFPVLGVVVPPLRALSAPAYMTMSKNAKYAIAVGQQNKQSMDRFL